MRSFLKSDVLDKLKEKLRSFLEGVEETIEEKKVILVDPSKLQGAEPEINTIIINNPAGAYCRIAGRRDPGSARCSVKFIGNSNWE